MSKLLSASQLNALHRCSSLSSSSLVPKPPSNRVQIRIQFTNSITVFVPCSHQSLLNSRRNLSNRAFESSSEQLEKEKQKLLSKEEQEANSSNVNGKPSDAEYPSGEFEFKEITGWTSFVVKLRMFFAFPWERVKKSNVLSMKLRGQISDQLKSRFSSGLSLPQLCENFTKAAYDPRISAIYLQIEPLDCGWGKVEEIRRHILNFRKSGKLIVAYVLVGGEKEYYIGSACAELYAPPSAYFSLYGLTVQSSFLGGIFEKIGIEPQVQRIGKYKSAGDQLARKNMSKENCEMLTALLDNIYGNWLDKISSTHGYGDAKREAGTEDKERSLDGR